MKIEKLTEDVFKVTVSGSETIQQEVTVTDIAHYHLTSGRTTKEELLDFLTSMSLDIQVNMTTSNLLYLQRKNNKM